MSTQAAPKLLNCIESLVPVWLRELSHPFPVEVRATSNRVGAPGTRIKISISAENSSSLVSQSYWKFPPPLVKREVGYKIVSGCWKGRRQQSWTAASWSIRTAA